METYNRKSIFERLKGYCIFAEKYDFIEITEWKNGEGFDVEISGKESKRFAITYGQYDLLKKMVKKMRKWEDIAAPNISSDGTTWLPEPIPSNIWGTITEGNPDMVCSRKMNNQK